MEFKTTLRDMMMMADKAEKQNVSFGSHKCPECGGKMFIKIVKGRGRNGKAFRFWCDGPCKRQAMT